MATGAILSSTVTTVVHILTLPCISVTVNVSVFAPTSLHTNAVWLNAKLAIPHASEEPLFTAAVVVLPLPVASNCTVTFWQSATGATLSSTVTTAVHVVTFPFTSVTVNVTGFAPPLETV
jgi:hypothetical protein